MSVKIVSRHKVSVIFKKYDLKISTTRGFSSRISPFLTGIIFKLLGSVLEKQWLYNLPEFVLSLSTFVGSSFLNNSRFEALLILTTMLRCFLYFSMSSSSPLLLTLFFNRERALVEERGGWNMLDS